MLKSWSVYLLEVNDFGRKCLAEKKKKRHAPDQELPWFIISLVSLALWEEPHFQTSKKIYEVSSRPSSIATL
jgi:hypothetical protein